MLYFKDRDIFSGILKKNNFLIMRSAEVMLHFFMRFKPVRYLLKHLMRRSFIQKIGRKYFSYLPIELRNAIYSLYLECKSRPITREKDTFLVKMVKLFSVFLINLPFLKRGCKFLLRKLWFRKLIKRLFNCFPQPVQQFVHRLYYDLKVRRKVPKKSLKLMLLGWLYDFLGNRLQSVPVRKEITEEIPAVEPSIKEEKTNLLTFKEQVAFLIRDRGA